MKTRSSASCPGAKATIAPVDPCFIADIHLEAAMDDGSRPERLKTQIALIESLLPNGAAADVSSFRPLPEAADLIAQ